MRQRRGPGGSRLVRQNERRSHIARRSENRLHGVVFENGKLARHAHFHENFVVLVSSRKISPKVLAKAKHPYTVPVLFHNHTPSFEDETMNNPCASIRRHVVLPIFEGKPFAGFLRIGEGVLGHAMNDRSKALAKSTRRQSQNLGSQQTFKISFT
jgi:hypothetical protein